MELDPPPPFVIADIVRRALDEDLGRGDITTAACVAADTHGDAAIIARERLVVCGAPIATEVFAHAGGTANIDWSIADGRVAKAGEAVAHVTGRARTLLEGERVALNFMQRLSGIATLTRAFVDALPEGSGTRITDTRKTTPGLRAIERYAVRCGGGHNHRYDLGSAVLIKDNHIRAAGGIGIAIERARRFAPHPSRIECEVDDLDQLDEALHAGADIVLLDNFTNEAVQSAVERTRGRALLEASGGITLDRVPALATLGVDAISVGALTHSARAVDLALDWRS